MKTLQAALAAVKARAVKLWQEKPTLVLSTTASALIGLAAALGYTISSSTAGLIASIIAPLVFGGAMTGTTGVLRARHAAKPAVPVRRKKGGRLPGYVPVGLKTFLEYATKRASAPAIWPVPAGAWPIDNNDVEGDCTIAGAAHLLQGWNRLFRQHISIPVPATIRKVYRKLTGGGDTGLVEADVLKHWKASGLFTPADKIFGYAPIKITDHNAIKLAVARYGGAYLGIIVGQPQEEQFEKNQPWEWVPGQEREGHCVVGLGYTTRGLLCATWGGLALLTWTYLEKALEEAWVILPKALVRAGKDTLGLDLAQLEQDLAKGLS